MTAALLFKLGNMIALGCWLILAVSLFVGRLRSIAQWLAYYGLPILLGSAYVAIFVINPDKPDGDFSSIEGVRTMFGSDWFLLAGWLHYLVFDYFVGAWMVRNASERDISKFLLLPCLFFCLMLGPAGLLLYLGVRGGWNLAKGPA